MQNNCYPKKVSFLFLLAIMFVMFFQISFTQVLLDPAAHPKFVNPLPNPLHPSFVFTPDAPNYYKIGMYQTEWNILGTGSPMTNVYGYGNAADLTSQGPTYPGRTFVVQKNVQTKILWSNNIPLSSTGHLLPVDVSLHWAEPMPGMTAVQLSQTGVPVVPHVHGGHTESGSDGLPEYWFTPGYVLKGPGYENGRQLHSGEPYQYDNDQPAGTIWYHDHGLGITRLNVYAGLAGFYIIRDNMDTGLENNPLGLPSYPYEVPIVIQDRMFTADGQLFYPTIPMELTPANPVTGNPYPAPPSPSALPEFFGDFIVVNGVTWPVMDVEPRLYRFRFLNGSDSRFYNLWIGNDPMMYVIGTDNALLPAPVPVTQLTIAPGERYDVIVDFSLHAGQLLVLKNNARSPFPMGGTVNPLTTGQIMAFNVGTTVTNTANNVLPSNLGIVNPISGTVARTRKLALFEGIDQFGRLQPMLGVAEPTTDVEGNTVNGSLLWDEMHFPITENPMLNDVEIWEVYNATADAHPIHLHLVSFQIINRQKYKANVGFKFPMITHDGSESVGFQFDPSSLRLIGKPKPPAMYEAGWKDTYIVYPGEVARLIAKFDRPGRYVWHCHILSHEDHEMMRPYHVGPLPLAKQTGNALAGVTEFRLEQNYPNPFNPNTVINFSVPEENTLVSLKIYNSLGEEVGTLINQVVPAGNHEVQFDAKELSSGVYLYTLTAGNFIGSKKMILIK